MRPFQSKMSTSTLMAVAFTVPAALIAAGLILYPYALAQRHLTEEGINYGLIVTEPILSASQRFLREGAIGAVQEMIEDTGSSRTIEHLALIGGDGKVIASNRHDWIGRDESVIDEPDFNDVAAVARTTLQPQHRLEEGGRRLILVSPLLFEGSSPILSKQGRGVLYLKLDHERRLQELKLAILKRGSLSALGLLGFSLFLLLWVRTTLTRPILEVATFLRGFAKGDGERRRASAARSRWRS